MQVLINQGTGYNKSKLYKIFRLRVIDKHFRIPNRFFDLL